MRERKYLTKSGVGVLFIMNSIQADDRRNRNVLRYLITALIAVAATVISESVFAQAIDRVDVTRLNGNAEITIRFITQIQYLRHTPLDSGKTLRIYVRLTGSGIQPNDLIPETSRVPKSEFVPRFSVAFPEPDGAMLIIFDQPTRFVVRPNADARSISVVLPVTPGS